MSKRTIRDTPTEHLFDDLWPLLEPLKRKFKKGALVKYREPARWLSGWTDIPISHGDTGIIETAGKNDEGYKIIDLYGVRFFTCPEKLHYLSSPWLEEVK